MTRKELRKDILAKRNNLTTEFQTEASQTICNTLLDLTEFHQAENIALYIANKGEIDPLHSKLEPNKKYYLPILDPIKPNHLLFQSYDTHEKLTPNQFGILEPVLDNQKMIDPKQLDCVLVPLVGFDEQGNRLGMGVGYYDRSFSFLQNTPRPHKPILIGLAYSFQQIPSITPESWDIPLDIIVTEGEIIRVKNSSNGYGR